MKKNDKTDKKTVKIRIEEKQKEWLEAFKKQWTITGTCLKVGINRDTFYNWIKKYPEFRKRKKEIEKEQVEFVENKLYEAINNGNLGAIIFFLKCRGGRKWRASEVREIRGKIKSEIEQRPLTEEEKKEAQKIDKILKQYVRGAREKKSSLLDTKEGNKK